MAESKRESIGKIKIDLDVSDAITGLKAVQREAKASTKALAELREEQQKLSEIKYVVIVVDTPEQSRTLESALRSLNNDRTRFQALHVGQAAVGLHFKGTRPTTLILAYSELTTDQEKKWEREVIGNLGYADDHPTR
ncbi:hypothetical protein [Bacillus haynesii]|uniref:hypothetical protein n=1 Tax=Bacillus haynesii TaxID=1925021 RepID=UPI0022831AEC|nr:hypothetical protein [Bacillus haynesii]MCY8754820.1 hypothetical protein [Bacillus haynesii]